MLTRAQRVAVGVVVTVVVVHRWGISNAVALILWAAFWGGLVAGLVHTLRNRRHGRGEFARIDERHAADAALGPREVR